MVAEWKLVFLEEVDNEAERVSANALAFSLDADLNDLTDEASNLLQKLTKNDRTTPSGSSTSPPIASGISSGRCWVSSWNS